MQSKVTLTFRKIEWKSILYDDFQSQIVKHFENTKEKGGGGRGPLVSSPKSANDRQTLITHMRRPLRTFARNFSNIDFFQKILPLEDDELAMSEM